MTGAGNNTYLLPGGRPTLIDAGTGDTRHLEALAQALGHSHGRFDVLVTHAHTDHISGVPALAARWPETRFRKYPWPERDAPYPLPWHPIADGEFVPAGDLELQALLTAGHAPDHLCFWHAATRTLFCGDLVVPNGSVVIPARRGGNLRAYLASLERVIALEPARLLPAHGSPIDNPGPRLREHLEHRLRREAQVLEVLRTRPATVHVIVETIYDGLRKELVDMARDSILAHLIKLEEEGRVAREDEVFHLTGEGR